ncbi:hypothetical protein [Salinibacter ruber]|uniref:hypothetical protein n=1 Tax=Salinibacter ruber TaxID=146919 RepID=UPI000E5725C5|nr:hypothetical protein [Salinibacter ruber]
MPATESSTQSAKRPDRSRSSPDGRGNTSPSNPEDRGAEAYLDLFGPPALADTADTYFQAFTVLRALLQGAPKGHAYAILDAAEDVAESHVERRLSGGGQDR